MKSNELSSSIKNVAEIVRNAEILELYATLLDLYAKAIELQDENKQYKEQMLDRSRVEAHRPRGTRITSL